MTALQEISNHPGRARGIRLWIKRDDQVHPEIQGNKWRKLQLLLAKLQSEQVPGIITFGGPFSNHLHAVAAAGPLFQLATVGIVRGESADLQNPTLAFAAAKGMDVVRVSKKDYDQGITSPGIAGTIARFPGFYVLPEGGSTSLGVKGCTETGAEILLQITDNQSDKLLYVCVPAGTGCTVAGVIAGLKGRGAVLVFPAAAYGVDRQSITAQMIGAGYPGYDHFQIIDDYMFGGFARWDPKLQEFTQSFQLANGILPDPVYTAKMLYGIYDMLEKGFFPDNSCVVAVHTGGLQGWAGFNARYGKTPFIFP